MQQLLAQSMYCYDLYAMFTTNTTVVPQARLETEAVKISVASFRVPTGVNTQRQSYHRLCLRRPAWPLIDGMKLHWEVDVTHSCRNRLVCH